MNEMLDTKAEPRREAAPVEPAAQPTHTDDAHHLLQGAIDALTSHIAILDHRGAIIEVNRAWREFAEFNQFQGADYGLGCQYINVCQTTAAWPEEGDAHGITAAQGIRAVMDGSRNLFTLEYPCHAPTERRWFLMRVTRFGQGDELRVVVAHENITERKLAEEALRESEERYRTLVGVSPQAVWMAQPDGRVTYCNQYWLDYTGLTFAQTATAGWVQAVHPDHRLRALRAWRQAVETGGEYEVEVPFRRHSDGKHRWHLVRGVAARDAAGAVIKWIGIAVDIHERIAAEQRAARANQRFEMAEAAGRSFVFAWEVAAGTVERSQGFHAVTGYTEAEFAALPGGWRALLHPDDVAQHDDGRARVLAAESSYDLEYRVRHKLGYFIWVRERGAVERDAAGRAARVIGIITDVTSNKRQQELAVQLLASEQEHARKLQQLYEASLAVNRASSVAEIARLTLEKMRELIGAEIAVINLLPAGPLPLAKLTAQDWAHATTTVSLSDRYAAWRDYEAPPTGIYAAVCEEKRTLRLTTSELQTHLRWRGFSAEGSQHPALRGWLAAPLVDSRDQCIGLIQLSAKLPAGNVGDGATVETQAALESEFTAADEALLGQLAQVASIAIEKQRLYEQEQAARSDAETANRLKDEFLSTVSHELRTPLNAITGWAKMLRAGGLDEATTAKAIVTIDRNADMQNRLIDDLLDTSRIITGKFKMEMQPTDLALVIEAALDSIRPAAAARAIRLNLKTRAAARTVNGDPARLQQVIWNLLSNAVKFTPVGGAVEVALTYTKNHARVSITDTGIGIAPEFLPYVFERFRQADGTINRRLGGLGLGLAIVRHIVEMHGGQVTAASAGLDCGATFTLKLPLAGRAATATTVPAASPAAENAPAITPELCAQISGLRLLVVDDNTDGRELVVELLQNCGAQVTAAGSLAAALALLALSEFDLLLVDLALPDESGYELIRQVRQREPAHKGHPPALALTAHARSRERVRAMSAGFNATAPKPINPVELVALLASLAARFGLVNNPGRR